MPPPQAVIVKKEASQVLILVAWPAAPVAMWAMRVEDPNLGLQWSSMWTSTD